MVEIFKVQLKGTAAITIGVSAGGFSALSSLLPLLKSTLSIPVVVVQHLHIDTDSFITDHFNKICTLPVREVLDKMTIEPGVIYIGPPNYHLLIERCGRCFSLSVDEPVNYARPSIDVLFESAALAWGSKAIGIILTGANSDGTMGLIKIKETGGKVVVQDPDEAEYKAMPLAAISACNIDEILTLKEIANLINSIVHQ